MENSELAQQVNKELGIALPENISAGELKQKLSAHVNHLILHNFEYLVTLLYRIDVSEQKIKSLLQVQPGVNAGDIIADCIIERQMQKIQSRKQFKAKDAEDIDEEKW